MARVPTALLSLAHKKRRAASDPSDWLAAQPASSPVVKQRASKWSDFDSPPLRLCRQRAQRRAVGRHRSHRTVHFAMIRHSPCTPGFLFFHTRLGTKACCLSRLPAPAAENRVHRPADVRQAFQFGSP